MSAPIPSPASLDQQALEDFEESLRGLDGQEGIIITYSELREPPHDMSRDGFREHLGILLRDEPGQAHKLWDRWDDRGEDICLDYWTTPAWTASSATGTPVKSTPTGRRACSRDFSESCWHREPGRNP